LHISYDLKGTIENNEDLLKSKFLNGFKEKTSEQKKREIDKYQIKKQSMKDIHEEVKEHELYDIDNKINYDEPNSNKHIDQNGRIRADDDEINESDIKLENDWEEKRFDK
jgi:hypothetical protein